MFIHQSDGGGCKRHAGDLETDDATPACLRAENVRAQARETTEDLPNVDSTRSRHLRNAGTAVRPRLRAGNAADGARTFRAPAAPAKPATTGAATHPVTAKVNLNTATLAELDKVSQIGPARSKAIVEARTKEKFKNWDDFVVRKVVPADAAAAMKDVVSF